MNTLLRRFFILAAVLLCCTAMANAANPDAVKIDGIYYILDDENNTATVTWGGEMMRSPTEEYSGNITIPAKVTYESKEYIVTSIGASAFYNCWKNLTSIAIPNSVKTIGDSAFAECYRLASVTFEEGSKLESIGAGAFANSYALASITIPSSVTSIGASAFYQNYALTSITIPSSVTSIGASAFYKNTALTSITIPSGVTSIGDNTFYNCSKLATVTFAEGSKLESIGAGAFANSYALASITIPSGVTSIGDNAFNYCHKLASVTFEEGSKLESIGASAFYQNYALTSITIPSSVTSIGASAFYKNDALTSITIPSGVTSIGDNAFAECTALASVTFEEGSKLESIGASAFYNCWKNLTSIAIPNSVKTIGDNAFAECNKLASITIPNSVTSIGLDVFNSCINLQKVYINIVDFAKDNVIYNYFGSDKTIKYYYNGSEISGEFVIPETTTSIGKNLLQGCTGLTSITIPNSVTSIGNGAFDGCTNLQNVNINVLDFANNNVIYDRFNSDETIKYYYNGEEISGELTIPNTTASIGNNALKGVTGLTSVTIPNSVTSIGNDAFSGCTGLTSITIPNGVTTIGERAFDGCTNLQNVNINILDFANNNVIYDRFNSDETIKYYYNGEVISGELVIPENTTSIGNNALKGVTGLTSVTIPNSVTSIGSNAFEGCTGLTSVTIPNGVTTIGERAFDGCTNLQNVNINVLDFANNNVIYDRFNSDETIKYYYNGEEISGELTIPNTTASIGNNALKGVTGLTSVTIPNSVTSIGNDAFSGCTGLTSVTIPNSVTTIGSNAFEGCTNLQNVNINVVDFANNNVIYDRFNSDETIKYYYNGEEISGELTIPNTTASIGNNALKGVTGLTSVTIPNSVTSIGNDAFSGCTGLTSVTIPNSVTSIGEQAFDGCTNLQNVNINVLDFANNNVIYDRFNSDETIKYYYNGEEISGELTIPNTTASIGNNALKGVTGLTSVTIPSSVTSIGSNAFYGCTNLQNVNINVVDFANNNIIYDYFGTNKTIKYYYNGEVISGDLTISSTTTAIGNNALKGVTGLTSVTIPNSVTSIGSNAFEGCTELETVSVQWTEADKIPDISGKNVFNGIALSDVTLNIPYKKGNIRSLYTAKDVWKDFNIVFAKNFIITKSDNTTIEEIVSENSDIVIDESDITKLLATEDVPSVKSITYTRDFTNVAGKWQTWFVPFEAPVSALNDAELDVAEVGGILFDKDKNAVVAFNMMDGGTMKANTPYVVRLKADATNKAPALVFENANLKATEEDSFSIQSAYDKFTFTGNYESKHVDDSYTLNKDGEFMKMGAAVNLKPMRFSLAVTPRDDSPYTQQTSPMPVIRYMVLGDDGTLQPIDEDGRTGIKPATTPAHSFKRSQQPMRIYDLHGRKVNRIQSKQVYIIDGKTYTAR